MLILKNKKKNILLHFTHFISIIFLCVVCIGITYIGNIFLHAKTPYIMPISTKYVSSVYDDNDNLVLNLAKEESNQVTYEELPDVFIDALLSEEDVRFFLHNGIDIPRLLSAIYTNVKSGSYAQGASTLTQQLVKNTMLNSNKTLKRKLEEAYLANKIEKIYSKKEIIELYANYICFDGINPGVNHASLKYFNKPIFNVTLPEAALLVGMVNLPSYYNPFKNPIPATKRRNEVIDAMEKQGFIHSYQAETAKSFPLEKMLYYSNKNTQKTYPYQAYLDIVYTQIKEYTKLDPYTTPMKIYTYLDPTLQAEIDLMQENKSSYIHFDHDLQQFAATILNNENGSIIAAFGGRNYAGRRLFNRAYDMVKPPASTIKPILSYALAYQHLNWSDQHKVLDIPTTYPNTNQEVNNVDHQYMGELMIDEAIGYSRNTIAVNTLKEVADTIGMEGVISYLEDIHLLDTKKENVSFAYALGAFAYGVSPTNLAAAYAMIANQGIYKTPLAVKKIVLLNENKEIDFTIQSKRVLDKESTYLLNSVMEHVMQKNFWNINMIRPENMNIAAKTGTSSFDRQILKEYNYPSNAYKDRWLAGYSKNITIAAWTGFDTTLKDQETYFVPSSNEANIVKKFFKRIMEIAGKPNLYYEKPDNIASIPIVKGSYPYLLPTTNVNSESIVVAQFKKDYLPTTYICEPSIQQSVQYDYYVSKNKITILIPNQTNESNYHKIFDYEKIYGALELVCEIKNKKETYQVILNQSINEIDLFSSGEYQMNLYYQYKNGHNKGPISSETFQVQTGSLFT